MRVRFTDPGDGRDVAATLISSFRGYANILVVEAPNGARRLISASTVKEYIL